MNTIERIEKLRSLEAGSLTLTRPPAVIMLTPEALARSLPDSAGLLIDGVGFDVSGDTVQVPSIPDGRYDAALVGPNLTAAVTGPVMIEGGRGTATLRAVDRVAVRLRSILRDNGQSAPYRGAVQFLSPGPDGWIGDAVATADDGGWVTADLRPGETYRVQPTFAEEQRLGPAWRSPAEPAVLSDGAEVVVAERTWNVRLIGPAELAGVAVSAFGEAGSGKARFDQEGIAYLSLALGSYALQASAGPLEPGELVVGGSSTDLRVSPGVEPPPPLSLSVRLEVPEGEAVGGRLEVTGPGSFRIAVDAADGGMPIVVGEPGPYTAVLRDHPTLDGEASVQVVEGDRELVVVARPGPRSTWTVFAHEAGDVYVPDGSSSGEARGRVGEPFTVRPDSMRRVIIPLELGLLLGPLGDTTRDATFRFDVDATVDAPRALILAYTDGWVHVAGAGSTMVRFDPSAVYAEEEGEIRRFDVSLAAGERVVLENGQPATESELDRLLAVAGSSPQAPELVEPTLVARRDRTQPFPTPTGG